MTKQDLIARILEITQAGQPVKITELVKALGAPEREARAAIEHLVRRGELDLDDDMRLVSGSPSIGGAGMTRYP